MVSGVPDKPHLQLPFQPVDHQAGGQLGKRLQRALENLRKQHKWGDISDEEYRTERNVLVRQLKLLDAAVKPRQLPNLERAAEFLQDLRTREGMGARALEFDILTAARSGEIRGATWDEIDLTAKVWTIPADRMKAGKPHRIPLSPAAVTLLGALPRMQGQPLVFPAVRGGKISDVTILATVKRMNATKEKEGGEQYTDPSDGRPVVPHGFRSAFKDWARNRSSYSDEVSELALAHVNSDATRAAYARDELLPQRTKLMTAWADYCAEPAKASASVTAIRREA